MRIFRFIGKVIWFLVYWALGLVCLVVTLLVVIGYDIVSRPIKRKDPDEGAILAHIGP